VQSTGLRSGKLGGQKAGGIKLGISWCSATVSLARRDGALSAEKRKTHFQMLHNATNAREQHLSQKDVAIVCPID